MAVQGSATLNFGAIPGNNVTFVDVAAPTMTGAELTSAWIAPVNTVDHNIDEHVFEEIEAFAGPAQAGVGFRIYGKIRNGTSYGQYNVGWVYN